MDKNEILKEIENFKQRVEKNRFIRSNTRKSMFSGLNYLSKFLTSLDNDSTVSYSKTMNYIEELRELIGTWCRKDTKAFDILDEIEVLYKGVVDILGEVIEKDEPKEEVTEIEEEKKEEEDSVIIPPAAVLKSMPTYFTRLKPKSLEKYDVSYLPIGPINHYCIIAKIDKSNNSVFVIPITTDVKKFTGQMIEKSRFFQGKAVYSLHQLPYKLAISKFVMQYDNKGEVIQIIKNTFEHIRKNVMPRVNRAPKRCSKKK